MTNQRLLKSTIQLILVLLASIKYTLINLFNDQSKVTQIYNSVDIGPAGYHKVQVI